MRERAIVNVLNESGDYRKRVVERRGLQTALKRKEK